MVHLKLVLFVDAGPFSVIAGTSAFNARGGVVTGCTDLALTAIVIIFATGKALMLITDQLITTAHMLIAFGSGDAAGGHHYFEDKHQKYQPELSLQTGPHSTRGAVMTKLPVPKLMTSFDL